MSGSVRAIHWEAYDKGANFRVVTAKPRKVTRSAARLTFLGAYPVLVYEGSVAGAALT